MSELEQMTKAELLEHARALGVSPANNMMTKAELIEGIEQHEAEAGVEGQATTTATKDYLGRLLITPSVNSKDYLGRSTTVDKDHLSRFLLN
jgi:hypothetical protein